MDLTAQIWSVSSLKLQVAVGVSVPDRSASRDHGRRGSEGDLGGAGEGIPKFLHGITKQTIPVVLLGQPCSLFACFFAGFGTSPFGPKY